MLEKAASAILILVGLVNIAPVIVFFFPGQTKKLYGLPIEGENLMILMRHRGVLLALVGLALIYAAFKPEFRMAAIIAAFISKIVFIFLTFTSTGYSPEIRQVALIDVGAMVLLGVVLGIQFYRN
ncbi:MAG: hypothetical protein HKN25_18355 [Pyrinomonadaceae bacterium]|nr:hypothetical protein [Pyrinomonadaceae bacterium]